MDEISRLLAGVRRVRSDSVCSDGTQSTGSKLTLRHRLNQLMTCVDDLDLRNELHEKILKTLDVAFLACGKTAGRPRKSSFRWRVVLLWAGRCSLLEWIFDLFGFLSDTFPVVA